MGVAGHGPQGAFGLLAEQLLDAGLEFTGHLPEVVVLGPEGGVLFGEARGLLDQLLAVLGRLET